MGILALPDVTLVMVETMEHALARMAVEDCLHHATFGDVLIFTDKPEEFSGLGRIIEVPNWPQKKGWSWFSWFGVPPHVRTRQTLYIQWDAWIWKPEMWRNEFLDYDIVGAPWWYTDGRNVGNLGFAIRSTRLIRYLHTHQSEFPCDTATDDDLLCRVYRPRLEERGFVWAPESVARDFAFECVRPSPQSRHFGFHGMFNWGAVLDEERLRERVAVAKCSPYITNSYIWKAFLHHNPGFESQDNGQYSGVSAEKRSGLAPGGSSGDAAADEVLRSQSRNAQLHQFYRL